MIMMIMQRTMMMIEKSFLAKSSAIVVFCTGNVTKS